MFKRKTNTARNSSTAHILDVLHAWWNQDRIRISPREGRLLTLQAPCIVEIHGDLVELTDRIVGQSSGGPDVVYRGKVVNNGATVELCVQPGDADVRWTKKGVTTMLAEHEFIVYDGHSQLQ